MGKTPEKIVRTEAEWRAMLTPGAVPGPARKSHRTALHRRAD